MADDFRRRSSPAGPREEYKLFVGGIPHRYNDRDLRDAFKRHNSTRATVMIDRKTGRSRGFGFVYFSDRRACEDAMERMDQVPLEGRKISVNRAVPETQTVPGTPAGMLAAGRGLRASRGASTRDSRRDGQRWSSRSSLPSGRRDSRSYDRYERSSGRSDRAYGGRDRGRSGDSRQDRHSSDRSEDRDRGGDHSPDSHGGDRPGRAGPSPRRSSPCARAPGPPPFAAALAHSRHRPCHDDGVLAAYQAVPLEDITAYIAQLNPPAPVYPFPNGKATIERVALAPLPQASLRGGPAADEMTPAPQLPLVKTEADQEQGWSGWAGDGVGASGGGAKQDLERERRSTGVVGGMRGSSGGIGRADGHRDYGKRSGSIRER